MDSARRTACSDGVGSVTLDLAPDDHSGLASFPIGSFHSLLSRSVCP